MLPTKTLIRTSDPTTVKKNWKPSAGESAAAFIAHIAVSFVKNLYNILYIYYYYFFINRIFHNWSLRLEI